MAVIVPVICVGIITILLVYVTHFLIGLYKKQQQFNEVCKGVSGFPRHWFFGNAHQMADFSKFLMDIQDEFVIKSKAKLCVFWLFNQPVFLACHPDVAKVILRSSEPKPVIPGKPGYHFLQNWLGESLLISNGPKWERTRRLLTPAFHFDVLGPYFSIYNQVADVFLDNIAEISSTGSVEVFNLAGLAALDTLLQCSFSYKGNIQNVGESHPYVTAVQKLGALVLRRSMHIHHWPDFLYNITSDGKQFQKLCDYVHDFSIKIIKERRKLLEENPEIAKRKNLDFLDILLTARDKDGNGLDDIEIQNEVDTFMFAGHDTTSCALSWALYNLGKYKDIQEKVYTEVRNVLGDRKYIEKDDLGKLSYLNCFLRESMRYHTPVPVVTRGLSQSCVLDGVTLPKGSHIDIFFTSIHHHPDVWKDHLVFSPERFQDTSEQDPFSYTPFSAGPRNCIGQHFALNEVKVMIARTVCRFEVLPDQEHEPDPFIEVVLRSKNGIQLYFKEREHGTV